MLRRSCRVLEKLVIVESPNKVIKVEGLLSDPNVVGDWSFGKAALQRISTGPEKAVAMATLGHFMALKEITWTPQNTQRQPEDADFPSNGVLGSFSLEWEIMAGRRIQDTVARAIEDKTTNLSEIIIATDPDREGELIAVHALSLIKRMNPNLKVPYSRAYIHSITAEGIQQAMRARSTNFDHNLATAAEARHAMDRIFGFLGSSVVRYANPHMRSIGRVQTPALILIHEREKRIQHVMETTSSTFDVKSMCKFPAAVGNATFTQAVVIRPGSKSAAEKSGEAVRRLAEAWKVEAGTGHRLASAPLRQTQTLPPPEPFTMATLIAKANRQFHLSSEVVSGCLQDLFQMGYITYPRTDSTRIDEVVREAIYKEIEKSFGARMVHRLEDRPAPGEEHNTARRRKTRGATAARKASAEAAAGNVEDAHEAIRPTNITKTSESLGAVSPTMKSIYGLIRKQTLAAFMLPMETERIAATIRFSGANGDALQFQIEGKHALEAGWSAAFRSSAGTGSNNNNASIIPAETELDTAALENGEVVVPSISDEEFRAIAGLATTLAKKGLQLRPAQVVENRPSPPLPYSEGGLIEQLKNHGVGRPSTYPIIVKTLLARNYITVNRGRCETTEVGRLLVRTSSETFPSIVDIGFTASFEKKLDRIAKPSVEANQVLRDHPALTEADYVLSTFVSRLLNYITEATRAQRVKIAERSARLKHDDGDSQELLEDRLTEEKSRSLAQVPDLLDGSKPYRTFTAVQNYLNDYLRRNFPQSPLSGTPLTSIPKRAPWRKKKTYTKRSSWAKK